MASPPFLYNITVNGNYIDLQELEEKEEKETKTKKDNPFFGPKQIKERIQSTHSSAEVPLAYNNSNMIKNALFNIDIYTGKIDAYNPFNNMYSIPTLVWFQDTKIPSGLPKLDCVKYVNKLTDDKSFQGLLHAIIQKRVEIYDYMKIQSLIHNFIVDSNYSPLAFTSNAIAQNSGINVYSSNQIVDIQLFDFSDAANKSKLENLLKGVSNGKEYVADNATKLSSGLRIIYCHGNGSAGVKSMCDFLEKHTKSLEKFNIFMLVQGSSAVNIVKNKLGTKFCFQRCIFDKEQVEPEQLAKFSFDNDYMIAFIQAYVINKQSRINSFIEDADIYRERLSNPDNYITATTTVSKYISSKVASKFRD